MSKEDDLFQVTDIKFDGQKMTAKVKVTPQESIWLSGYLAYIKRSLRPPCSSLAIVFPTGILKCYFAAWWRPWSVVKEK